MAKEREKEEKYISLFKEICVEDEEDVMNICETASMRMYDNFKFRADDLKLYAVIFSKIYETVINVLEESTKTNSSININMVDTEMGYTSVNTEEAEKDGNFMIYIRYLYGQRFGSSKDSYYKNSDYEVKSADPSMVYAEKSRNLCVTWNTENITENPEILRQIASRSLEELKRIDILIGFSDVIIPFFVTTMNTIINYVKIKRKETGKFEYEINFLSCFYVSCIETEEGDEINFRPSIFSKLKIKNDAIASASLDK